MNEIQCFFQLQTAAGYIGAGVGADFNLRFGIEKGSGLVYLLICNIYIAAHDDGLGLGSGLRKAALHHKDIQSFFFNHLLTSP